MQFLDQQVTVSDEVSSLSLEHNFTSVPVINGNGTEADVHVAHATAAHLGVSILSRQFDPNLFLPSIHLSQETLDTTDGTPGMLPLTILEETEGLDLVFRSLKDMFDIEFTDSTLFAPKLLSKTKKHVDFPGSYRGITSMMALTQTGVLEVWLDAVTKIEGIYHPGDIVLLRQSGVVDEDGLELKPLVHRGSSIISEENSRWPQNRLRNDLDTLV